MSMDASVWVLTAVGAVLQVYYEYVDQEAHNLTLFVCEH